jgi:hypothetical protein
MQLQKMKTQTQVKSQKLQLAVNTRYPLYTFGSQYFSCLQIDKLFFIGIVQYKKYQIKLDVSSMLRMPPHSAKVLKPCLIFSNFKGDNCEKSLDQQFHPNIS